MPNFGCWADHEFQYADQKISVFAFNDGCAAVSFAQKLKLFKTPEEAEKGRIVYVQDIKTNEVTRFKVHGWLKMQYFADEDKEMSLYKCFAPFYQKEDQWQHVEQVNELEAAINFTKNNIKDVFKNIDANFLDVNVKDLKGKTTLVRVTAHRETSQRLGINEPAGTVMPINVKIVFKAQELYEHLSSQRSRNDKT